MAQVGEVGEVGEVGKGEERAEEEEEEEEEEDGRSVGHILSLFNATLTHPNTPRNRMANKIVMIHLCCC